ncbi:MAG: serine/threonine protein kinase [Solirubrobacterales bacterium]|nr:serine/threonine protein kinase [Solirubrobacterales bacterium]
MGNHSQPEARVRKDLGLPDRYAALRHIASGGMASVWCARDQALGRNVAIKLLAERFADEDDANERFLREARAAARLSGHPNVVMIYDVGETEADGRAFIVMEFLAGGTVADALRVDSVRRVHTVKWVNEAASALDYAHSRGVLHRDIKPANLLLDRDRTLHVADFGIARLGAEDTITGSGQVLGTASYLPPERALGEPATAASDRYSLAVAAFELLVGERPFTAHHLAAQARQHIEQAPPAASAINRTLPPSIDRILARGMAKRPEERWPTAQAFAEALESALTEAATRPHRAAAIAAASRPARQSRPAGRTPHPGEKTPNPVGRTPNPTGQRHARSRTASHAASRTGSHQPAASRPSARRRARIPALAALVAGAIAAVAIAGTMGGGGGHPAQSAASVQRQASAATHKTQAAPLKPAAAPKPKTTPTVTATPAAATTPPPTADTLEARGHQLMEDGSYGAAISVLRQAVQAADPGSLTYAYALFDLGRSLRLSGDPKAAVTVLYQRLQIPDQTGVVRQQLQLALQALGQKVKSGGAGAGPGPGQGQGGPGVGPPAPGGPPATPGPGPQPSGQGNQGD